MTGERRESAAAAVRDRVAVATLRAMGGSHFRSSVIAIASVLAVVLGVFGAAPQQSAGTVERASAKGVKTRAFIRAVLRATTSESVLRIRTNGTRVKVRHKAGATTRTRTLKPRRGRVVHRLPVGTEKVRVRATGGRGHRPSKWRSVRVRPTPPRKPVDLVGPPEQVVGSAHVPIGVWLESVTSPRDISLDKAAGINTYVGLTTSSDLGLATDAGMSVILQQNEWLTRRPADHDGWVLADEIDMQHSPGPAPSRRCPTSSSACPPTGSPRTATTARAWRSGTATLTPPVSSTSSRTSPRPTPTGSPTASSAGSPKVAGCSQVAQGR